MYNTYTMRRRSRCDTRAIVEFLGRIFRQHYPPPPPPPHTHLHNLCPVDYRWLIAPERFLSGLSCLGQHMDTAPTSRPPMHTCTQAITSLTCTHTGDTFTCILGTVNKDKEMAVTPKAEAWNGSGWPTSAAYQH